MSYLPKEALTLTGGCYCKAIRYSIKIPAWEHRPPIPGAVDTPISATEFVQTRMPLVDIDHCDTCRQVSGAMVQCWFICPVGWIEWDLLPKDPESGRDTSRPFHATTVEAIGPVPENKSVPSTYLACFNATDRATRTFCSRCGTNLAYLNHRHLGTPAAFVDVTVGSLDPEWLKLAKPERHGWWNFGVEWVQTLLSKGDGGFMIRHPTGDVSKVVEE